GGYVPIIGRKSYIDIINFVSNYMGSNELIKKYNEKWTSKIESIDENIEITQDVKNTNKNRNIRAYISTNEEFDKLLLDSDINPVIISSISNFFFNKNNEHIFDSSRSEDKVLKSITNIGNAIKEDLNSFDVDKYVRMVKEQIEFLDTTELK